MSDSVNGRTETTAIGSDRVDAMIALAGARPADHVEIVGGGQIELLLGLCRRGFDSVSCCAASGHPQAVDGPVDILWLPDIASDSALTAALARLGRDLRPGGTLIVGDGRCLPGDRARSLRRCLAKQGFVPLAVAGSGQGGDIALLSARKRSPSREQRTAA